MVWWLSVRESTCHCRSLVLDQGRSHLARNNEAHVPQLLNLCSRAWELQLLSPQAVATEANVP